MAFESLYDNFIAEYYDLSPIVTGRKDAHFYVSAAKEFGEPVLELGCGSGRVTLAVGQAGFRITELDLSQTMLAQAQGKIAKLPKEVRSRVTLVQGNMTNFDLDERFRLVIIPFRPFQRIRPCTAGKGWATNYQCARMRYFSTEVPFAATGTLNCAAHAAVFVYL